MNFLLITAQAQLDKPCHSSPPRCCPLIGPSKSPDPILASHWLSAISPSLVTGMCCVADIKTLGEIIGRAYSPINRYHQPLAYSTPIGRDYRDTVVLLVDIMVLLLLCQLSYAIKTQLKALNAPY